MVEMGYIWMNYNPNQSKLILRQRLPSVNWQWGLTAKEENSLISLDREVELIWAWNLHMYILISSE